LYGVATSTSIIRTKLECGIIEGKGCPYTNKQKKYTSIMKNQVNKTTENDGKR
jgi:hypothetical protein